MQQGSEDAHGVLAALNAYGILLESDPRLPSMTTLVAGEPIRGSWWGHPQGEAIFQVTRELADHPDILVTKLVSGKVTYVHRRLWPAVLAVACARESWQTEGLSHAARSLLEAVTRNGELRTDEVPRIPGAKPPSPGDATRELERRLLVHSREVHTRSGAHAKRLETWERWANRVGFATKEMTPERGKERLEEVVEGLNRQFDGKGRLPWHST